MTPAEPMGAIFTTAAEPVPAPALSISEMRDAVRRMSKPATYVRMTTAQWHAVLSDKSIVDQREPFKGRDLINGYPIVIAGSDEDTLRILRGEKSIDLTKPRGIDPGEVRK